VLTQAVTAKFKRAAGFHEAGKNTAATIAPTPRRRALEATAVAVIQIADNEENTDSAFSTFQDTRLLDHEAFVSLRSAKDQQLELEI
jgi:hypothetical protein